MIKVLYAGMADDILLPLLLIPTFNELFVICEFDIAFAKNRSWKGQKDDIKQILFNGNNENSHHRDIYLLYYKDTPIFNLDEPCIIIDEKDIDNCWTLIFSYNNKIRKLIYYHHTNFLTEWDKSITDINHVLSVGAPFPIDDKILNKMVKERCTLDCLYYDQFTVNKNTKKVNLMDRLIYINNIKELL